MTFTSNLYRHVKTGNTYRVLVEWALLEHNLEPHVVYRSMVDDKIWVRPYKEFFDGRFTPVTDDEIIS